MLDLNVNFSAVFLSAIFAFILGMIWYYPKVMGEKWLKARGKTKKPASYKTPFPYIATFMLWIVASFFYAFMANFLEINSFSEFFILSCLIWVAFVIPPLIMGALYTGYPFEAVAIDASYQLGGYYIFALTHVGLLYLGSA